LRVKIRKINRWQAFFGMFAILK